MKGEQLELDLWEELRRAQQMPETVRVAQILDAMEATVAQLPQAERLRFTGEALLQIADLCAARAGLLITEWEEAYRDPTVQKGFFDELVRQTMEVDLSDLMEPMPPQKLRTKRTKVTETEGRSIVVSVDKAALLAMVDQLEAEAAVEEERKQQVLAHPEGSALLYAHEENVSRWTMAISHWLQTVPNYRVSFAELCQGLEMPRVEVWLGVLLGEFELEGGEEFYSDALWVKGASVGVGSE